MKKLNIEKLPTELIYKDVNGKILSDKIQVLQRWKEYFSALLNDEELLYCEDQHLICKELTKKKTHPT
jgi:hypothetical protein